jgi:hypothetical protein
MGTVATWERFACELFNGRYGILFGHFGFYTGQTAHICTAALHYGSLSLTINWPKWGGSFTIRHWKHRLDHLKTAILLWSGEAASFSIIESINKPQSPKANTTNNKNKPEQQDPAEIHLQLKLA